MMALNLCSICSEANSFLLSISFIFSISLSLFFFSFFFFHSSPSSLPLDVSVTCWRNPRHRAGDNVQPVVRGGMVCEIRPNPKSVQKEMREKEKQNNRRIIVVRWLFSISLLFHWQVPFAEEHISQEHLR